MDGSSHVIVGKFSTKLDRILYVLADRKVDEKGNEYFHYKEAYILSEPKPENFVRAFKNSEIAIDLRLHIKENGQVRNRGTAFRVYEESLLTLFARREQVL